MNDLFVPKWEDNATIYHYGVITDAYSYQLLVDWNPFEKRWNWSATLRFAGADHAAFHQWGTVDTIEEAKQAAHRSINSCDYPILKVEL